MCSQIGIKPHINLGPPVKVKYPSIDPNQSTAQLLNSALSKQLQQEILEDIDDPSKHRFSLVKPRSLLRKKAKQKDLLLKINYLYLYEQTQRNKYCFRTRNSKQSK